jgi:hypothetical protein
MTKFNVKIDNLSNPLSSCEFILDADFNPSIMFSWYQAAHPSDEFVASIDGVSGDLDGFNDFLNSVKEGNVHIPVFPINILAPGEDTSVDMINVIPFPGMIE